MRSFLRRLSFATGLFTLMAVGAIAGNVGPMMIQQYGLDIDQPGTFWANIGGGAAGKLSIGTGLSNQSGALTANVTTVFGRTGTVTLQSGDVTAALTYTPLNKGGDALTGLLGFTTTATASAAGTTQGTATAITAQQTIVTTVASGTGVALNSTLNVPQVIYNRGANQLTVYPFSAAQIEAYGVNSPVAIAVGGSAAFRCVSTTQCYVGL
jgi:hypothetical protein